jgi:hypothetical protein
MATNEWLDQNSKRDYPFVAESTNQPTSSNPLAQMPWDIITDAGISTGAASAWLPTQRIWLAEVERSGSLVYFRFASNAVGLSGQKLIFTADLSQGDWQTLWADAGSQATSCDEPRWWGFLQLGRVASLDAWLPTDTLRVASDTQVRLEPRVIDSCAGQYLTSLHLANFRRTRVSSPDDCPELTYPVALPEIVPQAVCIRGMVLWQPGYNALLRRQQSGPGLVLGAQVGAGAGQACEEIPLLPGEVPPADSPFLSGGPSCQEVLRALAGASGPRVELRGGTGVQVQPDPANHRLIVRVDLNELRRCTEG